MAGDKNSMLIRRRPSVATLVAFVATLVLGSQTGLAAGSSQKGACSEAVGSVEVTATDGSSVTIAWPPSRDSDSVVGYGVYLNGAQVGTQTPDQTKRWRDRQSFSYTVKGLACGTGYTVGVDAVDRDDDHSPITTTTVSTSACPDTTPPSAPSGMRQVAATENSVVLAWTPSSDNVGVVEYGLYASGVRVSSVSDANATLTDLACGTSYLVAIDAADAAGNRSAQASSFFRTSACPSTNKPPSTPTAVKVAKTTETSVTLVVDGLDRRCRRDGLRALSVGVAHQRDNRNDQRGLHGAQVRHHLHARSGRKRRRRLALRGRDPLHRNIALLAAAAELDGHGDADDRERVDVPNLDNWRAVYDENGDGIEDDPGSIQFLIDGNQVLSEINAPFGDTFAIGTITASNGQHTFQVRALNDSGTLLATNTITATVNNQTPPPPPPSSTGTVTQTIANGSTIPDSSTGVPSTTRTATASRTTPARSSSSSTATRCSPRSTRRSATPSPTARSPPATASTPSRCAHSTTAGTLLATNTITATVNNQTPPPADTTAPTQPANLRVTSATATSVTIAWNAATDNVGVAGYDIYRAGTKVGTATTTSYPINGLSCGTAYSVGVRALDAAGNTSPQATISVTTSACADTQPPTAPTNVTASTRTTTSIALTWAPATDNVGVAGYGVYNGADLVDTTAGTTGIVSGLTCGTNYTLAVDAFDATGNSSPKTAIMVSTLPCTDTTPPTQPTNLRTTSTTTTSLTLAWNAATDNVAVASYDIFRAGTKVGTATTTSYTHQRTHLRNQLHVGVRAFDTAGNTSTATNAPPTTTSPCARPATGLPAARIPGRFVHGRAGRDDAHAERRSDDQHRRHRHRRARHHRPGGRERPERHDPQHADPQQLRCALSTTTAPGWSWRTARSSTGRVSGQNNCHVGIGSSNFTVRRTRDHRLRERCRTSAVDNVTFTDNYVHDLDTTGPSYVWGNAARTPTESRSAPGTTTSLSATTRSTRSELSPEAAERRRSSWDVNGPEPERLDRGQLSSTAATRRMRSTLPRQQTHDVYINRNRMQRGVYGYTACVRLGITVTEFNENTGLGYGRAHQPRQRRWRRMHELMPAACLCSRLEPSFRAASVPINYRSPLGA